MIILDRYEGEYAVIEMGDQTVNVDRDLLEENLREGDVLIFKKGRYYRDEKATETRKKHMETRFSKLWKE